LEIDCGALINLGMDYSNWLEYSVKLDRAFCFPCRMFTNSSGINVGYTDSANSKVGFNDWKLATTKFKAHQTSNTHLNSITSLTNCLHLKPIGYSFR